MATVGVNVFVMISGYFLCESGFKIKKLFKLWFVVAFYSIGICVLCKLTRIADVGASDIFKSFLPISYNQYWFMTDYFLMFLSIPVLNKLILTFNEKQHRIFVICITAVLSVWDDITPLVDTTDLNGGFSFVWFIALYFIASYLRKYINLEKCKCAWIIFFGIGVLLLIVHSGIDLLIQIKPTLSKYIYPNYFEKYNSFPILLMSLSLFQAFRRINISCRAANKLISYVAPLTIGVYLIHDNRLLRSVIWSRVFKTEEFTSDSMLIIRIVLIILIIFFICVFAEYLRTVIFDLICKIIIRIKTSTKRV